MIEIKTAKHYEEEIKKLKEKNQRLKDCIVTLLEEILGEELTLCESRGVESTNFEELCAMGGLAWQVPLCPSLSHQNEKLRKAVKELLDD